MTTWLLNFAQELLLLSRAGSSQMSGHCWQRRRGAWTGATHDHARGRSAVASPEVLELPHGLAGSSQRPLT